MKFRNLAEVFNKAGRRQELLAGLLLLVLLSCLSVTFLAEPLENLLLDFRFKWRGQHPFPKNIVIIGVDEPSLDVLGRWPFPRGLQAYLIDFLRHPSFSPKVLGYDVLFENKNLNDAAGDEALIFQAKNLKDRLVMAYFFEKGPAALFEKDAEKEKRLEAFALPPSSDLPEHLDSADRVSLPFLALSENTDLAFVNTPVDPDGRTRKAQLLMKYHGKVYPSMDLVLALHELGAGIKDLRLTRQAVIIEKSKAGPRIIPITDRGEMLINFYGKSNAIPFYSFVQILNEGKLWMQGSKAPPDTLKSLKNKVVVLGVTALGLGDRRVTSFHEYETGISLHAQALANILQNQFLARPSRFWAFAAVLLVGIPAVFFTIFLNAARSVLACLTTGLIYLGAAQLFFLNGLWLDLALPEAGILLIFTGMTTLRYFLALEELKRTHEQLLQSAKMASLGQLSAGIAHEFRNILNNITLNMECCNTPGISPEKLQKYLGIYRRTVANANLILEGLLTFARKSESIKKPGNLKKTIEEALLLIEKDMQRYQIETVRELEEGPEMIYDAGQIAQVIINLSNNARDAFKEKKEGEERRIVLRLKYRPEGAFLEIEDNGSGIPPHIMKHLFEPFVTSKPAGKGTGLGLSVCHGIIRNHGGDIRVTTRQGQGTAWHLFLPK